MLTAAIAATLLASSAGDAAWVKHTYKGEPVAIVGRADAASIVIMCKPTPNPTYTLVVSGPAGGLAPGRAVKAHVEGGRGVTLRFKQVTREPGGLARLISFGGSRGSLGDQSGTLEALEYIRTAKDHISVVSGGFRVLFPSTGVAAAMAPLEARCGPIKPMIKKAEGREGELP
jgi:hypothetical protein